MAASSAAPSRRASDGQDPRHQSPRATHAAAKPTPTNAFCTARSEARGRTRASPCSFRRRARQARRRHSREQRLLSALRASSPRPSVAPDAPARLAEPGCGHETNRTHAPTLSGRPRQGRARTSRWVRTGARARALFDSRDGALVAYPTAVTPATCWWRGGHPDLAGLPRMDDACFRAESVCDAPIRRRR